jgi:hypothetical protein
MNYESIKDIKWPIRSGWSRSNTGKYTKHILGRDNTYKQSTNNRTGMHRVFVIRQPSLMEVRLDDDHLNNICATLYSECCVGKSHLSTSKVMWSQEAAQPETLETGVKSKYVAP